MKVSNKKTALLLMAAAAVVFVLPLFSKTLGVLSGFGLILAILLSLNSFKKLYTGDYTKGNDRQRLKPMPNHPLARVHAPVGHGTPIAPQDD